MPPLVSIVVPSFQQGRFLRAAIDSVLDQDYAPIEVLVMDGGSTDDSVAILESYGERVRFRSGPDGGQCAAINQGFRESRGEFVAWLNSDDYYLPGAVTQAVEALLRRPDVGMVYGEGQRVNELGEAVESFIETSEFDLWRLANVCDYILQPAVFFRRKALFQVGLLDESLHWGLDWDLFLRIGKRFPLARVKHRLAASRIHGETKTSTGSWRRLREIHRVLKRHGVRRRSPAPVLHTIAAGVRRFLPASAPVTGRHLQAAKPHGLRRLALPIVRRAEVRMRRWMQNSQGIWPDGLVGRSARLWLPTDGRAARVKVRGRNLEVPGQVVRVSCGRSSVASEPLDPGAAFELELAILAGEAPIKLRLQCRRTRLVDPLDPQLGQRRAGVICDATEVVPACGSGGSVGDE